MSFLCKRLVQSWIWHSPTVWWIYSGTVYLFDSTCSVDTICVIKHHYFTWRYHVLCSITKYVVWQSHILNIRHHLKKGDQNSVTKWKEVVKNKNSMERSLTVHWDTVILLSGMKNNKHDLGHFWKHEIPSQTHLTCSKTKHLSLENKANVQKMLAF